MPPKARKRKAQKRRRPTYRCPECPRRFYTKDERREHCVDDHKIAGLPIARHIPNKKILTAISRRQRFSVLGPSATDIAPELKISPRGARARVNTLMKHGFVRRDDSDTGYVVTEAGIKLLTK